MTEILGKCPTCGQTISRYEPEEYPKAVAHFKHPSDPGTVVPVIVHSREDEEDYNSKQGRWAPAAPRVEDRPNYAPEVKCLLPPEAEVRPVG